MKRHFRRTAATQDRSNPLGTIMRRTWTGHGPRLRAAANSPALKTLSTGAKHLVLINRPFHLWSTNTGYFKASQLYIATPISRRRHCLALPERVFWNFLLRTYMFRTSNEERSGPATTVPRTASRIGRERPSKFVANHGGRAGEGRLIPLKTLGLKSVRNRSLSVLFLCC